MTSIIAALLILQDPIAIDQGTYYTFISGKKVASEGFKILDNGRSSSVVTAEASDVWDGSMRTVFATKDGAITGVTINVVGKSIIHVTMKPGGFVYDDGTKVDAEGTVFVAENLAWHTMNHVFRAYKAEGGKQTFKLLVPSLKVVVEMKLERGASSKRGTTDVWEWTAATNGIAQTFITDAEGKLLHATIPSQSVEIVRKGFESLMSPVTVGVIDPIKAQPNRDKYDEREFSRFVAANATIAGTLSIPKTPGRHPAVMLISGSGPSDRNWDAPPLMAGGSAAQIADRLAAAGFVVMRYDDRGVGKSTGDKLGNSLSNLVADAKTLLNYLKAQPEVDPWKIVVAGHSEGGVIAPMIAEKDVTVGGVIIIAGTSRPMDQIIVEQMNAQANDARIPQALRDQVAAMIPRANEIIAKAKAGERGIIDGFGMTYLREHFAHDPLATIREVKKPILIIQGLDDLQVLSRNASELQKAATDAGRDVTVEFVPRMSHFLTQFPYGNPDYNEKEATAVIPKVWESIIGWMNTKIVK